MTFGEKRFNRKLDKIRRLEESGVLAKKKKKSRAFNKFMSNKLAVFGTCLFLVILLACIFAPLLTPYDPAAIDLLNMSKPPNAEHIFGTDKIGRDLFARCLYGGRTSILIAGAGSLGGAIIGVILGCFAGYKGGWFDKITMRASEIFMSFPQLILVLVMLTIMGQSMVNIIIIFICTGWSGVYRQARAAMLSIREEEYVQALHAFGLNDMIVCFKHMLPNAMMPIITGVGGGLAHIVVGSAVLEQVFSIPGVGQYMLSGVNQRDRPVVCGCVIFFAGFTGVAMLIMDLCYAFLDPRIKAQYASGKKVK